MSIWEQSSRYAHTQPGVTLSATMTPPPLPHFPTLPPHTQLVSYAHIQPGIALSATITAVEDYGLLVAAGPGVKGLVPRLHASDLGTAKAMLKFKVGRGEEKEEREE